MSQDAPILKEPYRILLRAALGEGVTAVNAYRRWRAGVRLDNVDNITYRLLPLLFRTCQKYELQDEDTLRIRGVAKHFWLSNTLRMQFLCEAVTALKASGIEHLLFKGAALFARDASLAAMHFAGDYDILVRPSDALAAVSALRVTSLKPHIVRADQFAASDLKTIHAAHFVTDASDGSIDLHWRPLPTIHDVAVVDELFRHAEDATLAGRQVGIPALADALFLAVARPEPWEASETLLRAIEAAQILRRWNNQLDWRRFEDLVITHRKEFAAATMLRMLHDELQVPIAQDIVDRLWQRTASFAGWEIAIKSKAPYRRTALSRLMLRAIELARSAPETPQTLCAGIRALLRHPNLRAQLVSHIRRELQSRSRIDLKSKWKSVATRETKFEADLPAFQEGFSFPEDTGRWTDGRLAILELPVTASLGEDVDVRLVLRPVIPVPRLWSRFRSMAGRGTTTHYLLQNRRRKPIAITIKARVVECGTRKVVVVLEPINTFQPAALGRSDDARCLGLFVQSAEVNGRDPSQAL